MNILEVDNNTDTIVESRAQTGQSNTRKSSMGRHRMLPVSATELLSPVDNLKLRTVCGSHKDF